MRRRTFLAALGVSLGSSLAGCQSGRSADPADQEPTSTPARTSPTGTSTGTRAPDNLLEYEPNRIVDRENTRYDPGEQAEFVSATVRNVSDLDAGMVSLTAHLLNEDGAAETSREYTAAVLEAGRKWHVWFLYDLGSAGRPSDYTLELDYLPAVRDPHDVSIENASLDTSGEIPSVTGAVANNGDSEINRPYVRAVFYDDAGAVIGVGRDQLESISTAAPAAFDATVSQNHIPSEPVGFDLVVA